MAVKASGGPYVFVSAVSRELKDARRLVANCLRVFHDLDAHYQDEFGTESGKLLALLRKEIDGSDGVLQLVGEAYGAAPPREDPKFGPISFTQYEFLYALKPARRKNQKKSKKKTTWLIKVEGSCTRSTNVEEFVLPEKSGPEDEFSEVGKSYRARLAAAGGRLIAKKGDDDRLKRAIAEHNRRRGLQRAYFKRLDDHVYATALDDDQLVELVRMLRRLPRVEPRSGFQSVNLDDALGEGYVGRASLTYDVLAQLPRPGATRPRIVLQGLGGSGKTRVAIEIGHAYRKIGHHVLMIKPVRGRNFDEVLSDLAEDFRRLPKAKQHLKKSDGDVARAVRSWLGDNAGWLMIIDGVDDKETGRLAVKFCQEFPDGCFLITSYVKGYWDRQNQFVRWNVGVLGAADGHRLLDLLLKRIQDRSDARRDTLKLARLLGGHPLAIQHACGYLRSKPLESVNDYVAKLEMAPALPDVEPSEFDTGSPPAPVGATWRISLQSMRPASRTLLRLLSFLTDDPIPIDLITSPKVAAVFSRACATDPLESKSRVRTRVPMPPENAEASIRAISDALTQLSDYSLIEWHHSQGDDESKHDRRIRVHRLVLVMTQQSLRPVSADILPRGFEIQHAFAAHRKFMAHAIRFMTDYVGGKGPEGRKRIYPHLFNLASLYQHEEARSTARTRLALAPDELNFLGETFGLQSKNKVAAGLFARVAAMPGATAYERAKASQGAAHRFFEENLIPKALKHYRIAERLLDGQPDQPEYHAIRYEVHSGRGWVYRFVGDLTPAIQDLERALDLARQGGDQGQVSDALVNVAGAYDYAGDYATADLRYRDAVEIADAAEDAYYQAYSRYLTGWFLIRRDAWDEGMALCGEAMTLGDEYKFGAVQTEAAWIMAVGHALAGNLPLALTNADLAARDPSPFVEGWVHLIRGIVRFRAGLRDAASDFETAIRTSKEAIRRYENFDPLDTLALAHAGMALLGRAGDADLAVQKYQRARELATARGIVDIGRIVFSCFGRDRAVARLGKRIFGKAFSPAGFPQQLPQQG